MRPALRPARIPIRAPAGAATDRGRRATGRAGGERAAAPQHLTFYMVIHWRSTHRHASSPYLAGLAPQRFTSTKVLALR